jgi:AraC-like DNA-binding protein
MLAPFVQCYWAIRSDSRTLPAPDHGVIPGSYADIVFNVGGRVYTSDSGDIFVDQAKSFVVGPFDHFQRFRAEGQFEYFGVRFHLGRAPFSSHLPLGEARNGSVPLDAVWEDKTLRAEIQAFELRLAQVSEMAERIACVERFLMTLLRRWKEPDAIVAQALSLIGASKGQIAVERLAATLCISSRQLERKFAQHIGLSPKAFCRVTRFRQAKLLLESARRPSGCDLAYACGYYDQTHFIREFRWFTGQTPARYQRAQSVGFFLYDHQPNC